MTALGGFERGPLNELAVTSDATGARMVGGFLRSPSGRLVITTPGVIAAAAPAPKVPLVTDSFTDTLAANLLTHAADVGGLGWTGHPTTAGNGGQITSAGRLCSNGGTGLFFHTAAAPASPDYIVECDVVPVTVVGTDSGPVGRLDATAATYYAVRYNTTALAFQLQSVVAGVATQIGSFADSIPAGGSRHVALKMVGSAITVEIDGVQRIAVTDTAVTAAGLGGVRLTGAGSDGSRVHVDNFAVTPA